MKKLSIIIKFNNNNSNLSLDYCKVETNGDNKLVTSLKIIKDLANNPKLSKTPIVVLLNKSDLFEKELERNDFTIYESNATKSKSKDSSYCTGIIKDLIKQNSGILKAKERIFLTYYVQCI